jgi:hypothetical protein
MRKMTKVADPFFAFTDADNISSKRMLKISTYKLSHLFSTMTHYQLLEVPNSSNFAAIRRSYL